MEELTKEDLKLFFDKEIYLIKENEAVESTTDTTTLKEQDVTVSKVEEPLAKPIPLVYKGGNTKGIAIIINDDANEFLNTTDETLLLNILKAMDLSLEDVAIINQHTARTHWQEQIDVTKAIVFGILPSTYGFAVENYTIQQKEGIQWLFSDSLFALANDKVLKGKLWVEIQKLFV
ncbi:hypothetical protein MNBD_BACTEROID06-948 [hydrothermal vent metagenome]|uniref:Uncharacterized protein n=1 Tax=hydrothermal vent metagenome TaxID=652676 RepID=A0A3B0UVC3_9ZZZZ